MMTLYMTPQHRAHMRHQLSQGDRIARNVAFNSDVHVPVDVRDEQDAFVVIATLPGLIADDLSIEIIENTLDIHGEFKTAEEDETYLRRERPVGHFHRRLRFASNLVAEKAEAALKDGILDRKSVV